MIGSTINAGLGDVWIRFTAMLIVSDQSLLRFDDDCAVFESLIKAQHEQVDNSRNEMIVSFSLFDCKYSLQKKSSYNVWTLVGSDIG